MKIKTIGTNQVEVTRGDGKTKILFSCDTPVAAFVPGKGYLRTDSPFGVATQGHINKWLGNNAAATCPDDFLKLIADGR